MHDALGNAFVVKVGEFFTQNEVFKQRRAAQAGFERVLVIRNRHALVGCEYTPCCIYPHPVQRLNGCVEAIRRTAARFFTAVFFGQSTAGHQTGIRRDRVPELGRQCVGQAVLASLVQVVGHGFDNSLGLRIFFQRNLTGLRKNIKVLTGFFG